MRYQSKDGEEAAAFWGRLIMHLEEPLFEEE